MRRGSAGTRITGIYSDNPPYLDKKKSKTLVYMISKHQESYFRAILGVRQDDANEEDFVPRFRGRPLAWSDPQGEDEVQGQFQVTTQALRRVFGFSEASVGHNGILWSRYSLFTTQILNITPTLAY